MTNIGIITYHAAYNFGSMMQAFATQRAVEKLGYRTEIINYRMPMQKEYYKLYRTKYGLHTWLRDIEKLPLQKQRVLRAERFENFIAQNMRVGDEINDPEKCSAYMDKFDCVISGSDQIWNKHSLELERSDPKLMNPYLLHGFKGHKVSYASSIGNMTDQELDSIVDDIRSFQHISMREESSATRMSQKLGQAVISVVDPTFLIKKNEWIDYLNLKVINTEPYVLYYTLSDNIKNIKKVTTVVSQFASKRGQRVLRIVPYVNLPIKEKNVIDCIDFGPNEFMKALYNATEVVTDSYHGTILSVNLNKDFYSLCHAGGTEFRKTEILNTLGLSDRIISSTNDILNKKYYNIDYYQVDAKLDKLHARSNEYLKNALSDI